MLISEDEIVKFRKAPIYKKSGKRENNDYGNKQKEKEKQCTDNGKYFLPRYNLNSADNSLRIIL